MSDMPRWTVTILYRSANGPLDVRHEIEEIRDLHDLVEAGPHWDTIEQITLRRSDGRRLTLEAADAE